MFKPQSVFLDNLTGYFEIGLLESLGDSNASIWGASVKWGPLMGSLRRDLRGMVQIAEKHHITVGLGAHMEPKELKTTIGYDEKGKPIKDSTMVGWRLAGYGKGIDKSVLAPFDEVYHMTTIPTEAGFAPNRKLYTDPHLFHDYEFEAKSRKGVKGPLTNPTYERIMAELPKDRDKPLTFVICGPAGVGKTTLFGTFPSPRLFIDLYGGCEEEAKKPDTRVVKPTTLNEVWAIIKQVRDKGFIDP